LSNAMTPPFLKELIPGGIEYGTNLLVEFEADSLWYETSLTIAAHALRTGIKIDYHNFQHTPNDIRKALDRRGLDVRKLEDDNMLWIVDSYTVQTGHDTSKDQTDVTQVSVKLADWSIALARDLKMGISETMKRRLHIDDNTGILLQYNEEKAIIDFWRTRYIPYSRARECVNIYSLLTNVTSTSFYKQYESLSDGIIDFKSEEAENELQHYVRIRTLRGRRCDTHWRKLELSDNGEVALTDQKTVS